MLAHRPDGRSWTVRENLADILRREILGPADGPDEVIDVAPDTRYLVGRIAPVRLINRPDKKADVDDEEVLAADLMDLPEGRGVPAVGTDDNAVDAADDDAEDQPQKRGLMIPASMGLRFQIPADLEAFTVTASWGVYRSYVTDRVSASGRPIRNYRRTPVEVIVPVVVADLTEEETRTVPLIDEVALRIDAPARPGPAAGGDRVVQRQGGATPDSGGRLDVPDQSVGRGRRRGGVLAGR